MVSNRPWNIWHLWYPMLYSILYLIFNVIYIVPFEGLNPKGSPWIYKILDWKENPGRSVLMSLGLIFVAVPLASVALYFLTKFRDFLWTKKNKNSKVQPKGETQMNSFEEITNSRSNVVLWSFKNKMIVYIQIWEIFTKNFIRFDFMYIQMWYFLQKIYPFFSNFNLYFYYSSKK